jgi:hypothetical protein
MQSDLPEKLSANAAHCVWTGVHRLTKKASFNCKLQLRTYPSLTVHTFGGRIPSGAKLHHHNLPTAPSQHAAATCALSVDKSTRSKQVQPTHRKQTMSKRHCTCSSQQCLSCMAAHRHGDEPYMPTFIAWLPGPKAYFRREKVCTCWATILY